MVYNITSIYLLISSLLLTFGTIHAMSEEEKRQCNRIDASVRHIEFLYGKGELAQAVKELKKDPKEILMLLAVGSNARKNIARALLSHPDVSDISPDIDLAEYEHYLPINRSAQELDRSYFLLTKVTQHLPDTITQLILSRNRLGEISDFVLPRALVELDLAGNKITKVNLSSLEHLKTLWLDDNHISSIDQATLPTSLTRLEIMRNQLTEQPNLHGLTSLERLNLSGNYGISSFDQNLLPHALTMLQLHDLTRLRELVITRLPHLSHFTARGLSLRKLEISHAKIEFLRLENTSVKQLILAYNQFANLGTPQGHDKIPPSVEYLDMSNNPLEDIDLSNLDSLRGLNLANTKLPWMQKLMWYYKVYRMRSAHDVDQGNYTRALLTPTNALLIAGAGLSLYDDSQSSREIALPLCLWALYRTTNPVREN